MDRRIVYPGAIPLDSDMLYSYLDTMEAIGNVVLAAFGSGTYVTGLACTPSGLTVTIAPGNIMTLSTVDNSAYGSIPANTAALMKMGINLGTLSYNLAPYVPTTSGWSVNLLFEAQLAEVDGTPVVLPYYNAANPSSPYSGPNNTGAAQNTVRSQSVSIQIKSGTGAPSGTQPTPSVDAGWAALYVVTLTQGVGTISASNILTAPSAPFIGTKLGQLRTKLTANLNLYVQSPANGGNDTTNNGLGLNVAFASIQAAANALENNYDFNGYSATIIVGAGSFAGANFAGLCLGQTSAIVIIGAGSASTTIAGGGSPGLYASNGANIAIQSATITGFVGINCDPASFIQVNSGVQFGTCTQTHIYCAGLVTLFGNYAISGSANAHFQAYNSGVIRVYNSILITLTGAPAFSSGFCNVSGATWAMFNGAVSFSGTATGPKFSCAGGGLINTNGQSTSFFPGSTTPSLPQGTSPPTGFYI